MDAASHTREHVRSFSLEPHWDPRLTSALGSARGALGSELSRPDLSVCPAPVTVGRGFEEMREAPVRLELGSVGTLLTQLPSLRISQGKALRAFQRMTCAFVEPGTWIESL